MAELEPLTDLLETPKHPEKVEYIVDTRPLCQGMPFVLTDAAHPRLVLKHGGHFLVMDQSASVPNCNTLGFGYYRYDTRHLSRWELEVNEAPVSLLSSDTEKGYAGSFIYTNPQVGQLHQQQLTVRRSIVLDDYLWDGLEVENFSKEDLEIELKVKFYADFADMFEVRGLNRPRRGERMVPAASEDGKRIFLAYRGVDDELLETVIEISGLKPRSIADGVATFNLQLARRKPVSLEFCLLTRWGGHPVPAEGSKPGLAQAQQRADVKYHRWRAEGSLLQTDHEFLNLSLIRGFRDIYILRQPTPRGWGLAAGIPWYGAVFGRDSAITAGQLLPFHPQVAREALEVLAAYQGKADNDYREESAGKIMHEVRFGELARTGAIPHSPYYGSVDSTPLWLLLFCEYLKWTGDLDFAHNLWPSVEKALGWLDRACQDGGGYLTYRRVGEHGLENQGWKDSGDSVMHADGSLAKPPIAVCEAQGYLYAARLAVAEAAELMEQRSLAHKLRKEAADLKERFHKDFWLEEEKFVALALDGERKPAAVISSNPGHLLWTELLDSDKAQAVADRLMSSEMHSGWGIRTLSSQMVSFNPISYHNGTVWPHDNAIIGAGMRKIGNLDYMKRILNDLVEVSRHYPGFRLPELFSGFERVESEKPVDYPVSCSPQAWSAGSIFQLIQCCINFQPDAARQTLRIVDPALPDWLNRVTVRNLRLGSASMDLAVHNQGGSTYCQILHKSGPVRVIIESH